MYRQVVIEGSSSAKNYNDELGKHGFTGRLDDRLREDCQEIKRQNNWGTVDSWTFVNNYASPGRLLPSWAQRFGSHLDEIRSRVEYRRQRAITLGIFVLEGHPLALFDHYGGGDRTGGTLKAEWRRALEMVESECMTHDVRPLFIQMPPPLRHIGKLGVQIHQDLTEVTARVAHSLDDAPIVHVADMLAGQNIEPFLADDRMHPSAAGHELIYRHLLPLVYDTLELDSQQPLPNPDPAAVLHDLTAEFAIRHA